MVCLKPAIKKGGKEATPTLIAKKVVPQNSETAPNASHANHFSGIFIIMPLLSNKDVAF
jgi:hypothetical protein